VVPSPSHSPRVAVHTNLASLQGLAVDVIGRIAKTHSCLMLRISIVAALAGLAAACAARPARPPEVVIQDIKDRTEHSVRPFDVRPTGDPPPGVSLDDGVTEDEAVATALWNNAQLSADLATLDIARANLLEAGLLRNPSLQVLFPVGPKPFELALTWPIDQWIQRPRRVAAAQRAWDQVAASLGQNGLNTARDARQAHAALVQAQERARLTAEVAKLAAEIARITEAQLKAGDISPMELDSAQAAAASAAELAGRARHDLVVAQDRLRFQLGLPPPAGASLRAVPGALGRTAIPPVDDLREAAWARRPDLRAQEIAVAAAAQRAKWERSRWLVLAAILSSKEVGTYGVRTGPGVSADLPIFGTTRGSVARADAEVEQASRQYLAMRQRVDLEVGEAREALAGAEQSLAEYAERVVPALDTAAASGRKAYEAGEVSYLFVIELSRQLAAALLRRADLEAEVRRARAELDRSVGTKIETLKLP